jgi:membrane protein YqaA with SNARE-associated domain
LPIIGDPLCLAAGWLRLPLVPSLLAIAVGKAARYAVVAYIFM